MVSPAKQTINKREFSDVMKPQTLTLPELLASTDQAQRTGGYEKWLQECPRWDYQNPTRKPNLTGLSDIEQAEFLLCLGRIFGFYGLARRHAQEVSKDFLTAAQQIFLKLGGAKIALCYNYLALAEWRMGAIDNAIKWLQDAKSINLTPLDPTRLHSIVVESLILHSQERFSDILTLLNAESNSFLALNDSYLLALFYMNRGTALRATRKISASLDDQLRARHIFDAIGNEQMSAYVENNIAFLYRQQGKIAKAFEYAARALARAIKAGDKRFQGYIEETLALLYADTGDFEGALAHAERAVAVLGRGECYKFFVDSTLTLIKILRALGRTGDALKAYARALPCAETYCGEQAVNRLTEALECVIEVPVRRAILPAGATTLISVDSDFYSEFGLSKDSVAVVRKCEAESGDLVAVERDGEYYFGLLQRVESLLGLEIDGELHVFENIVGKVVRIVPADDATFKPGARIREKK